MPKVANATQDKGRGTEGNDGASSGVRPRAGSNVPGATGVSKLPGASGIGKFSSTNQLRYEDIPDRAFLKALYSVSILVASPVSLGEKAQLKQKGADIKVYAPFEGYTTFLDRKTITSNFTYLDGVSIKLSAWKSKNKYQIKRKVNEVYAVILIPKGVRVTYQGREIIQATAKYASYIICPFTEGEQINRGEFRILSSSLFKRMFVILPDEVIYMAKRGELKSQTVKKVRSTPSRSDVKQRPMKLQPMRDDSRNSGTKAADRTHEVRRQQKTETVPIAANGSGTQYKYKAVGRVLNASGSLDKFVIESLVSPGSKTVITKAQMVELCKKKAVSNIMLYTATSAAEGVARSHVTLRGNGIKISDLPVL